MQFTKRSTKTKLKKSKFPIIDPTSNKRTKMHEFVKKFTR